jgi:cytoskeleton-associated protein 5
MFHFIYRDFGPKVINIKPLIKKMPVLLEDRDKDVRLEGKMMVIEIYRWIGDALKPQLSSLKPVQVSVTLATREYESLLICTFYCVSYM